MPDPRYTPPPTVSLRWCPECGRHDRYNHLRGAGYSHNTPAGKRCPGAPIDVLYEQA